MKLTVEFPDTLEPNLMDVEKVEEKTQNDATHTKEDPELPYTHLIEDTSSIPIRFPYS